MAEMFDPIKYFWSRVEKTDSCWIWTGPTSSFGYGWSRGFGKLRMAHRISWTIHNSPIPSGMFVCHHCDNPPCVRPDHLFLGTSVDNNRDMAAKNRVAHGSNNGNSKLTEVKVLEIKRRRNEGECTYDLARSFSVHHTTICSVLNGSTWARSPGRFKKEPLTHCRSGHRFDRENTFLNQKGIKVCRQCNRESQMRYYRRLFPVRKRRERCDRKFYPITGGISS